MRSTATKDVIPVNAASAECSTLEDCRSSTASCRAGIALRAAPEQVAVARHFVSAVLRAWGLNADSTEAAVLVVSELVTNCALHGGSQTSVELAVRAGELIMDVVDSVVLDHASAARTSPPDDEHGRGLEIVQAMASEYRVMRDTSGWRTHVSFEV